MSQDLGDARRRLRHRIKTPEAPPGQAHGGIAPEPAGHPESPELPPSAATLAELIRAVATAHDLAPEDLGPGRRNRRVVAARSDLAHRATTELGLPSRTLARALDRRTESDGPPS